MNILVTGGAGFIGGHLTEAFLRDGHDVVVLDNFDPFYGIGIKHRTVDQCRTVARSNGATLSVVEGDVRDAETVTGLVADADVVFHQAAQAGVRTSVERPRTVTAINVNGTVNVLQSALDGDVERLVLASSSSVYGKPVALPYHEDHPKAPISPYGVSKLAGEHYARVYHELHGLPVVSLRYFTVYGPRMRPNMAISNFVSRCYNGQPPVVYGDGRQTRDFTFVDDVVDANRTLLTTDVADGEVLNVGSTDTIEIRRLAELVRDQLAPDQSVEFVDAQKGDADHTHADVSKARDLIGYEPSTTIEDGVERFIEWYRRNREWYEPLVASG
ncbi:NAD-dependent epimerase/dehydratase family protein [Halomarina oriensis]|uniref:NAD-dependent epimerase/dehydratase family protein n=1 Tax=Halomarina oriensis TaxID=671145 RepID=A0A6B0GW34_9EURY|nr:NAD-dependent epimerase/dehydratase family protein [Halomarina oriensis]MWG36355.1 NAD-dependent epimerase/dehydratase family protein [Halomarina oriensis]